MLETFFFLLIKIIINGLFVKAIFKIFTMKKKPVNPLYTDIFKIIFVFAYAMYA